MPGVLMELLARSVQLLPEHALTGVGVLLAHEGSVSLLIITDILDISFSVARIESGAQQVLEPMDTLIME
jgi:hypothetical protein